jgi:selenocysteine lyase/cysteine desulfurase
MATTATYDLAAARRNLPALNDVTYMNSATEGIMAEPVLASYFESLGRFERYGYWLRREFEKAIPTARQRIATLLSADPDEVCITHSGTEGCSFVIGATDFKPGDEILIGNQEHPALLYPTVALQKTAGVVVRQFTFHHDPAKTLASFAENLSPRTRLAAFSHVSCETGIRVPAAEMIALAHRQGTRVLLDGAQSVGSFPVNFRELGCDYLTGSSHKWLCGPKGTGILLIRQDRLDELTPRYIGGGSLAAPGPTNEEAIHELRPDFAASASRFEFGMRNPVLYAGIVTAIDYLNELGWDAIVEHEKTMSALLKKRLGETEGAIVQTPLDWESSSAIVNLSIEGVGGDEIRQRFWDDFRIVQRAVRVPSGVRISCAYFSAPEDIERVVEAVTAIRRATRH